MNKSIENRLQSEAADLAFARRAFPMWTGAGFADFSLSLHSIGVSYWVTFGHELDYCAIADFPAPSVGPFGQVGDNVRSDAVWFDRSNGRPILLAEFERYDGLGDESKLLHKAERLLLAHHRWDQAASFLVLAYWTKGIVNPPNHVALLERIRFGFTTRAMQAVTGTATSQVLFYQFIHHEAAPGRWQLWKIQERGVR